MRQDLGAALLKVGRVQEAKATFRENLTKFPDNGWSLYGLQQALSAQGKTAEAAAVVAASLDKVWATADVEIVRVF